MEPLNRSPGLKATWGICQGSTQPHQLPPSGETLGFSLQPCVNRPMGEPGELLDSFWEIIVELEI